MGNDTFHSTRHFVASISEWFFTMLLIVFPVPNATFIPFRSFVNVFVRIPLYVKMDHPVFCVLVVFALVCMTHASVFIITLRLWKTANSSYEISL